MIRHATRPRLRLKIIARAATALAAATALVAGCGAPAGADYLPSTPLPTETPSPLLSLSEETMSVKGNADAPLLMIEFSDYECPFCNRYVSNVLPRLSADYIDTGKLRYVFRDYPLSAIHPTAQRAAEAARCAGEQGGYWAMHEQLFARQAEWQGGMPDAVFGAMAGELGLEQADFERCLSQGRYTEYVQRQTAEGARLGISGTPSFFIGGQFLSGAQPYEVFQQVIERQLAER